jgi:hypothetical protein
MSSQEETELLIKPASPFQMKPSQEEEELFLICSQKNAEGLEQFIKTNKIRAVHRGLILTAVRYHLISLRSSKKFLMIAIPLLDFERRPHIGMSLMEEINRNKDKYIGPITQLEIRTFLSGYGAKDLDEEAKREAETETEDQEQQQEQEQEQEEQEERSAKKSRHKE